jgi:hypothetical protein
VAERTGASRAVRLLLAAGTVASVAASWVSVTASATDPAPGNADLQVLETAIGYTPERARALADRRNGLIQDCMAAAGFSWSAPFESALLTASPHGLFGLETPESVRRYRLQYGYGAAQRVYVLLEEERQFAAGDPNAEHLSGLSPERQEQYAATLLGPRGCEQTAIAATGGAAALSDTEPLATAYAAALDAYRSDPAVQRAEDQVLRCLRDEGHDFPNQEAILENFLTELGALVGGSVQRDEQGRLSVIFGAIDEGSPPVRVATSALDGLAAREAEVARDEVACRDQHSDELGQALARHVRNPLEQHAGTIRSAAEAYRAAAREE